MNTNKFENPEWYKKGKYEGYELVGLTESSIFDERCDPVTGDVLVNQMTLELVNSAGEGHELNFYNYRIYEKNFEYTPLAKFTWSGECFAVHRRGRFYIEIKFATDGGGSKLLELEFDITDY